MRLLITLLAIAGAACSGAAQTNIHEMRKISLEDCIETALKHNLDLQIKRVNPEISRFTLEAVYGAYDPNLSASGEHDYNRSSGGIDAQGRNFSGTEADSDRFSAGLSGLLPWGMNYNLGGSLADQYGTRPSFLNVPAGSQVFTNTFFDVQNNQTVQFLSTNAVTTQVPFRQPFETTAGSIGLFTVRQPLLKNFWIDSTRLQILLDKGSLKQSELDVRLQVMTTVTAVEEAYYNLIFSQENIKVQQKALELAERLVAENKKRVEVGALAPLDEKQAESQAAGSRADLLSAIGTEDTQQRVLKNLLSDDYSRWKDVSIQPATPMLAVPERFDLQESWHKGMTQRPELLQQRISTEKQGHILRFQKNQLYPQLDLFGTAGYNASAGEFSGAFDQFANRDNPYWSYGAQISVPLSRKTAKNNFYAAKATKEQIDLQLKQLEQNVLIDIENAIAVANTRFQQVNATREARIYAEAALEAEQKKLESGKSTSFEVLRLQRDLTTARSAEIRSLADYNIALSEIALKEGSTMERRHVSLEFK
jgi:outer membrane protein TolC